MRRMISFDCDGDLLAGTLDAADSAIGLLIVSGGNEIRSGAHAGQAAMAQHFSDLGYPVFRYDRRGIGESEGENQGFESSADDIAAAVATFRAQAPRMQRLVAYGNCDAATALAFVHKDLKINALILANPWVIAAASGETPTMPPAAAIRARYLARLKNPRSLLDLFTGKIEFRKLALGLAKAVHKDIPTGLAAHLADTLAETSLPVRILIAQRDTTALAFMGAYNGVLFNAARRNANISLAATDSVSHSFADATSNGWLIDNISGILVANK